MIFLLYIEPITVGYRFHKIKHRSINLINVIKNTVIES